MQVYKVQLKIKKEEEKEKKRKKGQLYPAGHLDLMLNQSRIYYIWLKKMTSCACGTNAVNPERQFPDGGLPIRTQYLLHLARSRI